MCYRLRCVPCAACQEGVQAAARVRRCSGSAASACFEGLWGSLMLEMPIKACVSVCVCVSSCEAVQQLCIQGVCQQLCIQGVSRGGCVCACVCVC